MFSWLRWRKVFRELRGIHTPLVVLCLFVGAAIVGMMTNTQAVLTANIDQQFEDAHAASAILSVPEGFDTALVKTIRKIPEIEEAEGRRVLQSRINVGPDTFVSVLLFAIDSYDDIRINKLQTEAGAWPPKTGEVLLERSSLRLSGLSDFKIGDLLSIEKPNGKQRALSLGGLAYDFNQEPSAASGMAYGYITLDTLEELGAPRSFNQLTLIVAENKTDTTHIQDVVDGVERKINRSGRTVKSITIPTPGKYPLADAFTGLGVALIGLGVLTLAGGVFLVINTISALLAQQVRQIGMMKAVGAQTSQIVVLYMTYVMLYSVLALLVATPLAALGGRWLSGLLGDAFNIKLVGTRVLPSSLAIVVVIVFLVPVLAALYPIIAGTRVTVQEAINDYGLAAPRAGKGIIDRLTEHIRGVPRPILLSLRNTLRRKTRLIFTLLALMLSGAVFMAAANVRAALEGAVDDIFTYRNYQVRVFFDQPYRTAVMEQAILGVPGTSRVEGHNVTGSAYRKRSETRAGNSVTVLALDPSTTMFRPPVISGRWLQPTDQATIVINTTYLRDEPDIQLGDTVIFKIDQQDNVALRVVGITEEAFALPSIYLNTSYYDRIVGNPNRVNAAWVTTDQRDPSDIARDLELQLDQRDVKVARLETVAQERSFVAAHTTVLTLFLQVMAVLLVFVGGLGLMGTMSINVIERRREIGLMRAVGASDSAIQRIVIIEGIFIGVLSWALSAIVTAVPTKLIGDAVGSQFLKAPLQFTYALSGPLIWLGVIVLVAALSCYVPARRVTQIEVRELLTYE